jgi:hypothetical protein
MGEQTQTGDFTAESAKLKVRFSDEHRVFPSNTESSLAQYLIHDENNNVEHITKQNLLNTEDEYSL